VLESLRPHTSSLRLKASYTSSSRRKAAYTSGLMPDTEYLTPARAVGRAATFGEAEQQLHLST
jgi:hypothetical protein